MKFTEERLINIIINAINKFEFDEYEHLAILEYLDINEEEYKFFKELDK